MHKLTCTGLMLLAVIALQGCGPAPSVHTGSAGLDTVSSLDVYVDGSTLHLLLAGTLGKTGALRYLQSTDGGATWSKPVAIDTSAAPPYGVHRGDDAQIAAAGNRLVAVWPTRGQGWGGSGPMASAVSTDGGRSWQPGPDPADRAGGNGFIDMMADAGGVFHIVWLDSRTGKQGLRYARSADGGRHWSSNLTIDNATCECCWNTLEAAPDGRLYVLYRNIEPRDMGIAESTDDGASWRQVGPAGDFNWNFNGCPHTGGGLVATSDGVLHALVWTGRQGRIGLYSLTSTNGGRSWQWLQRLGDAGAQHAGIAAKDAQHIAAVWDAATRNGSVIVAAESRDGGRTWTRPQTISAANVDASHPRVVATASGYRAFWTQGPGVWATVRLTRRR